MPAWIGLALLSVSWLLGLHYYHAADWPGWAITVSEGTAPLLVIRPLWIHIFWWVITVAAGTALLATRRFRLPAWWISVVALLDDPAGHLAHALALSRRAGADGAGLVLAILAYLCQARSGALVVPPSGGPVEDSSDAFVSPNEVVPVAPPSGVPASLVAPPSGGPADTCRLKPGLRTGGWLSAAAGTCLLAGCILLAQSLAMFLYEATTSRSHDLPAATAQVLAAVLRALGVDANARESTVAVFSMRQIHRFGATWELLLDPPTWCFLVGGFVLLWWKSGVGQRDGLGSTSHRRAGLAAGFLLLVAVWLPFRAALLIAVYLDRVLRLDYDAPMDSMKLFWNPWVLLAMLAGPVLLGWAIGRRQAPRAQGRHVESEKLKARYALSVVLGLAAVGLIGLGLFWEPAGARKPGRVLVEECYPKPELAWERTDRPYDTTWYGEKSGYNYYCIFDYCKGYYDVARQTTPLDDAALENCDVLVLKTPTRAYSAEEIDAVVRFVERGGGLMLIGEHTDVFGCGTYLNSVAQRFGFSYRFDCLFGVDSVFEEHFDRPLVPHPIIQYMKEMDFAISCSIDPGTSRGRAAICNTGLKSLMADYHADNFYPQPVDSAEMRDGAFIQLWAVQHGRGRVAAFTDSTVFSNFCTFEPGKAELMMGMLEWLNHQSSRIDPRPWLLICGLILLPLALVAARGWPSGWIVLVAAGLLGWSSAAVGSRALNRLAVPPPPQKARWLNSPLTAPCATTGSRRPDSSPSTSSSPASASSSAGSCGWAILRRAAAARRSFRAMRSCSVIRTCPCRAVSARSWWNTCAAAASCWWSMRPRISSPWATSFSRPSDWRWITRWR